MFICLSYFLSVSRLKLLAILHKQPHLDIRRIYGFCWSGESTISQSLGFSFFMPRLTTGGDCLSRSHAYYKTKSISLVEIVSLVPMLITKRKAYSCFRLPGSKLTTFPTPFTPTMYSALLVLATSTLPTFDIPCLFQLNILILVRVIKEMTTLVQPMGEDNHIKQIRLDLKFAVSEIF